METSDEMDNVERQELRRGGTAGTTRTVTRRPTTGTWRVVTSTSKGHDEKTRCKRTDGKDDEQSRGRQHWRSKSTNIKEDGAVDDHDTRWSSLCGEIDELTVSTAEISSLQDGSEKEFCLTWVVLVSQGRQHHKLRTRPLLSAKD